LRFEAFLRDFFLVAMLFSVWVPVAEYIQQDKKNQRVNSSSTLARKCWRIGAGQHRKRF